MKKITLVLTFMAYTMGWSQIPTSIVVNSNNHLDQPTWVVQNDITSKFFGTCDVTNPSNNFQSGRGCSVNNNWTAANDLIILSGEDALLNSITPNILMSPGATATSVDVIIYDDAAGLPGNVITTQLAVVPVSSTVLGNNFNLDFSAVELNLTPIFLASDPSIATVYWVAIQVTTSDGLNAFWEDTTASSIGADLAFNTGGAWAIPSNGRDGVYTYDLDCDSINDDCVNAIALNCDETILGETSTATDSGANAAPDVFYTYTGSGIPENITLSLCDVGTDYDSLLRVFDGGCALANEIAVNDDFCGSQSELTFLSDGVITYTIMVEGFGAGSGNFSLAVNCEAITPANDDCVDAIALNCGETILGETTTATDSGVNAAPDVFYTYTGGGAPENITLSLCDGGTDYDSLLRVFDDGCALANEIAVNDDFCGGQSELTFLSDGVTTYTIMVEGFGAGFGNFSLAITCAALIVCEDPTDIAATDFAEDSLAISWTAVAGAESYNWEIQNAGTPQGDTGAIASGNTTGTTDTATGVFVNDESYTLFVQTVCANDQTSDFTSLEFAYVFLGIDDVVFSEFSMYPNPATDIVNLNANNNSIASVQVFNLLGQQVLAQQPNVSNASLDVSGLRTGTYMVQVTIEGVQQTFKLLKK